MKKLLFNPGPTNVSEDVRSALKTNDICHRESEFFNVLANVRKNLLKVVNGEGTHTVVAFVSSGTGCNEAVIASIHGKILLINNGKYAQRMSSITKMYRIPFVEVIFDPMEAVDVDKVEETLMNNPDVTHMLFVHHETTTGMLAPLHELCEVARKYNVISHADTISSLGGYKIDLQEDQLDFCTVSSNKCLQSFPGVAFVIVRRSEIEKLEGKSRNFYFDLYGQWKMEETRSQTPFTPAVQLFFAVNKAIEELLEEGVDARIKRQTENAAYMRKGLRELGYKFLLPEDMQSRILTSMHLPKEMDYWKIHDLLKERGFTIYSSPGTLGKGIFRVATLGHLFKKDIKKFLINFKEIMDEVDFDPKKVG